MPIHGDPTHFAIEYVMDDDHFGIWLNGQVRCWVANEPVGPGWQWMSLRDLLSALQARSRDWGHRMTPRLHSLSGADLAALLNQALYLGSSAEVEQLAQDEQWARHEIAPAGLLGGKLFVVDDATTSKLVCLDGGIVREVTMNGGEVDQVLRALRDDLAARLHHEEHQGS